MDIPAKHVYEVLKDKGVDELYHANSIATACQFIRSRSLMSRGTVERLGVTQTPQTSDDIDKRHGIWFDVFMDSIDIHNRARRANVYGPVLFVMKTEIIKRTYTARSWVTKLNPTKWAGKSKRQRWFQDKKDLEDNFIVGQFDQMIVERHCGGELPFKRCLKKIVLDDPDRQTDDNVDIYSMAVGALRLAMDDSDLDFPIEMRQRLPGCECEEYWGEDEELLLQMFDPKI